MPKQEKLLETYIPYLVKNKIKMIKYNLPFQGYQLMFKINFLNILLCPDFVPLRINFFFRQQRACVLNFFHKTVFTCSCTLLRINFFEHIIFTIFSFCYFKVKFLLQVNTGKMRNINVVLIMRKLLFLSFFHFQIQQ